METRHGFPGLGDALRQQKTIGLFFWAQRIREQGGILVVLRCRARRV